VQFDRDVMHDERRSASSTVWPRRGGGRTLH
jgi:hypothetical protein